MIAPDIAAFLVETLDRFLEAAANVAKWRALGPGFKDVHPGVRAAFLEQGDRLIKTANAAAREGARDLVLGAGLWSPLREASLSQEGWLDAWDEVATETAPLLIEPIQLAASAGMEAGAAAIGRQLEIDTAFDLTNPRAVEYLSEHGAEWVSGINDTTRDRIRTILRDGAAEGASYTEIANRIGEMFREFAGPSSVVDILLEGRARSRAEIVSITELGQAYEAGNLIVVQDLTAAGLEMQKAWKTVNDDRVDQDICAANQAQGWIAVEDAFQSGHMTPLGHPIYRCYARVPQAAKWPVTALLCFLGSSGAVFALAISRVGKVVDTDMAARAKRNQIVYVVVLALFPGDDVMSDKLITRTAFYAASSIPIKGELAGFLPIRSSIAMPNRRTFPGGITFSAYADLSAIPGAMFRSLPLFAWSQGKRLPANRANHRDRDSLRILLALMAAKLSATTADSAGFHLKLFAALPAIDRMVTPVRILFDVLVRWPWQDKPPIGSVGELVEGVPRANRRQGNYRRLCTN